MDDTTSADQPRPPDPGDAAPAFTARDETGREVSATSLRGSPYVLFFYPRADTPG